MTLILIRLFLAAGLFYGGRIVAGLLVESEPMATFDEAVSRAADIVLKLTIAGIGCLLIWPLTDI